jgi:hypothetical protein
MVAKMTSAGQEAYSPNHLVVSKELALCPKNFSVQVIETLNDKIQDANLGGGEKLPRSYVLQPSC